jgi:hypothetical protein
VIAEHGLHDSLDLEALLVVLHHRALESKKVGNAHFFEKIR